MTPDPAPLQAAHTGKMLCPPGALTFVLAGLPPKAGYSIKLGVDDLYRNGEYVGRALAFSYDADAGGVWVEYRAKRGGPLDRGATP